MTGKRITMSEIATKLNLSVNAVSLALNDKKGVSENTRSKVLKMADELGFFEQNVKYMATFSNKNICILLEQRLYCDMQFYGPILLGAENTAKEKEYDILVKFFESKSEVVPECVKRKKVSGIMVVGKLSDHYLTQLKSYGLPIVLVDHISLEESTDCIVTDNKSGTFQMTKILIDRGIRKIGFLGGIEFSPSFRERFWGYQEAVQEYMHFPDFESSIEYVEKYSCLNKLAEHVISNDVKSIENAFLSIKEKPEALICANDKLAILLCKILQDIGYHVPDDISVAGFDDIQLSKMVTPGIMTVHVSKELMGRKGMERLIYKIAHPKDTVEKIVMNVQVVERDSVKKFIK